MNIIIQIQKLDALPELPFCRPTADLDCTYVIYVDLLNVDDGSEIKSVASSHFTSLLESDTIRLRRFTVLGTTVLYGMGHMMSRSQFM